VAVADHRRDPHQPDDDLIALHARDPRVELGGGRVEPFAADRMIEVGVPPLHLGDHEGEVGAPLLGGQLDRRADGGW
jgi:hypothetical protein